MIIDLESHIWNNPADLGVTSSDHAGDVDVEPWYLVDASGDAHDEAMRCVDVSVVLGFKSQLHGMHIPAETIAAFVAKAPARRLGFAGIDPLHGQPLDDIDHAVSLGLVGVVMSPSFQNFHPTHSRAMRIYERCQELGLPIIIKRPNRALPESTMEYGRPYLFDEVARSFPRLNLVIGQMGYPFIDETLLLCAKHRNVFTDLAGIVSRPWQLYNGLLSAFENGVIKKVLFASDFPFESPERAIERVYSINTYSHGTNLPSIPRQQLSGIVQRDSLNCLGLERPGGASVKAGATRARAERTDQPAPQPTLTNLMKTQGETERN